LAGLHIAQLVADIRNFTLCLFTNCQRAQDMSSTLNQLHYIIRLLPATPTLQPQQSERLTGYCCRHDRILSSQQLLPSPGLVAWQVQQPSSWS
jgi:hypothetical protein